MCFNDRGGDKMTETEKKAMEDHAKACDSSFGDYGYYQFMDGWRECLRGSPAVKALVDALEFYRDTKSDVWDHSTSPPRLSPTLGYGPYNANQALAAFRKETGEE